jgi:cytidylate kinase
MSISPDNITMTQHFPGGPAMSRPMVIAIDGPAGAGKSTVTRRLAARLGLLFLDTGAMYRAATVAVLDSGVARDDAAAVAAFVKERRIDFDEANRVRVDGRVLDEARIRAPATTAEIWRVADHPACREHLVRLQRALLGGRGAVVEGRDATTVICPDAQLKVFLDASPEERACRRLAEWPAGGVRPTLAEVAAGIWQRDERDSRRPVGPLTLSDDAVHLVSDGLTVGEVTARLVAYAVQRQPFLLENRLAGQLIVGRSRQAGYVRVAVGGEAGGWQLGLTNPAPDRLPDTTVDLTRNHGGRQAGTLVQGAAILCLAGRGDGPGELAALPMLPQTWYVIEPGAWHAVIQEHGTICAWAEASTIREERRALGADQLAELRAFLNVYLPR